MCLGFQPNFVDEGGDAFFDLLGSHGGDCKYFTIDSFNDSFSRDLVSKLSIISFNIRSFQKILMSSLVFWEI